MIRPFLFCLFAVIATAQSVPPQKSELTADDLVMTSTVDETRAVCTGHVVFTGTNLRLVCDRLEIITARSRDQQAAIGELKGFKYLLATGNVHLVQGLREATCERAEVLPLEDRVVLSGDPVLIDRSSDTVARGDEIVLRRGAGRLEVKNPKFTGPALEDLGPDAKNGLAPITPKP